jgi:hypothetical protein
MKRLGTAVAIGGLLVALSAPAATATTTRIPVMETWAQSEVVDPGTWTQHGDIQRVRGLLLYQDETWDNALVSGPADETINWDQDIVTGLGRMWGTEVHHVTAYPGAEWQCTFQAKFLAAGGYAGKGACNGTGPLDGWKWRVDVTSSADGTTTVVGYIFKPADKPSD